LPILAQSYALWFTSQYMMNYYTDLENKLRNGDYSTLPDVHATSSGLKAITTWMAAEGIEECRQRCGGHGFLRSAGLSDIYTGHLPACTYEGDNLVLCQQTARFLIKQARMIVEGKKVKSPHTLYLNEHLSGTNQICSAAKPQDFLDPGVQSQAFNALAREVVLNVYYLYEHQLKKGISQKEAWNIIMSQFKELTEAHSLALIFNCFVIGVERCEDGNLRNVLKPLCDLYALHTLLKVSNTLILTGYFNKDHVLWIKTNILELLGRVRQNAVPLVDAWSHDDFILNSALGRYDGNVYETLYEESKKSELNKTDVIPAYETYTRPLLKTANL